MSLLFRILYAAHANGTHHKLALDALRYLACDEANKWRNVFLAHAEDYMKGSKAPDKTFKDFKNHVYHVRDNGWGGAPTKAREWYSKTVIAFKAGAFEEAVYNAGVLSHYYTDPVQPFHTAQSEAENSIHRAAEWSISKSYGELWKTAAKKVDQFRVDVPAGRDFVETMVREGATFSSQYYEKLIQHYNFDVGVVDPPMGFNAQGKAILSELIAYAAINFSRILSVAIEESGVRAPETKLTAETAVAALKIPVRWVTNKIEDAEDRKLIEAMYDELQQTGSVSETLTEDDRTIRDLHREEVSKSKEGIDVSQTVAEMREAMDAARATMADAAGAIKEKGVRKEANRDTERSLADRLNGAEQSSRPDRPPYQEKFYVGVRDDVENAPSIGKKTAERLSKAGVHSVSDLLSVNAEDAAEQIGARHITADVIRDWQHQAQLCCELPRLRGTYAKLLVGAGFPNIRAIAKQDPYAILNGVDAYLLTSEGKRAIGTMKEPDLAMVQEWIEKAIAQSQKKAA